jgi:teichuronic acid biosynthesis glycosyltransferase TuaG
MPAPLISIIMPTFNVERFISESLSSITQQTYTHWELLVTDDCSSDGTNRILDRWAQGDSRIDRIALTSNGGPAAARNASIDRARGEFLAFLDADDLWLPDKLQTQVEFMNEHAVDFSFTPYEVISESGAASQIVMDERSPRRVGYRDLLLKRATMGCSTVMVRRSIVGALRNPGLRQGQDYAFWLSILRKGIVAHRLDRALTRYRKVPGSVSANKLRKARRLWQIYRDLEQLPATTAAWYFANYAVRFLMART